MKVGDLVRITKPSHFACGLHGIVMKVEWLDGDEDGLREVAEVAGTNPLEMPDGTITEWPLYVVRLQYLAIVESCDPEIGRRKAQEIAKKLYARGCALQFPELVTYPNTMSHITG
jgi:hypothetical protein